MYKDLISYELAEGVSVDQLKTVADTIVTTWMKKLPGFISWEINRVDSNAFIDIVSWETEADARNAEKEMANIPNAGDWFACYKEGTISSKAVKQVKIL